MKHLKRQIGMAAVALLSVGAALFARSDVRAITISPNPPNLIQASPTSEGVNWNTDVSPTTSSLLQYGTAYTTNWTNQIVPTPQTVIDIDALDSQNAFALDAAGNLYGTSNGGSTWVFDKLITGAGARALEVDAAFNAWVAVGNMIYKYVIGSGSSATIPCSLGGPSILDMKLVGSDMWVVNGSLNVYNVHVNTAGCPVSAFSSTGIGSDPSATGFTSIDGFVDASSNVHAWAVSNDVGISRTDNGGSSWTTDLLGTVGNGCAFAPSPCVGFQDVRAVAADEAFVVGLHGGLYHYKAGTWKTAPPPDVNLDFHVVGTASGRKAYALGCCSGGKDYYSFSGDGDSWSSVMTLSSTVTATQTAYFVTPNVGWIGGTLGEVTKHTVSYPSNVGASDSNPHTATATGLQEATNYHANASSNVSFGSAETGDFLFKAQGLSILAPGVQATPQANSATLTWNTPGDPALAADSRVYASPNKTWKVTTGVGGVSPNIDLQDLDVEGDASFAVGSQTNRNSLVSTTDLGQTWSVGPLTPSQSANGVAMLGRRGWVVGNNFIWKTTDGSTWSAQTPPGGFSNYSHLGVFALDDSTAWIVGGDNFLFKGYLFKTTNGGSTWQSVYTISGQFLRDVVATDANTLIAVGDTGTILRSTDGGTTWGQVPTGINAALLRVSFSDSQNGWVTGVGGVVLRTTDGGKSWSQVFANAGITCVSTDIRGVAAAAANDVWFVGSNGLIVRWTGGATGCAQFSNLNAGGSILSTSTILYSVDADGNNVWASGSGGTVARYGIDTATDYHVQIDPATGSSHSVTLAGLASNTTYRYFVQSYDKSGGADKFSTTSGEKSFTTLSVPTLQLSTSALNFSSMQGTNPAPLTFQISDQFGGSLGPWNLSVAYTGGSGWLNNVAPASGNVTGPPATVTVSPDIVTPGLAPGNYSATITVNATGPGVLGSPKTVTVNLSVTARPKLVLSATSVSFNAQENQAAPVPVQAVDVTNGTPATTLTYTFAKVGGTPSPWLTLASTGGPSPFATPSKINVTADITGLSAGNYTETVRVTGTGPVDDSPQDIAVALTVTAAPRLRIKVGGAPQLNPILDFSATQAGPNPPPQTVELDNAGSGTLSWSATSSATWLVINPTNGGNGPTAMTISPQTGVLVPGPHQGTITVNAPGAFDAPQTITVNFTINAAPVLSVDTASLRFTTPRLTNPPEQTFIVKSGAPAPDGWTGVATTNGPTNWLSITPTAGADYNNPLNPAHVNVDVAGLIVGTYTGNIRISSNGALPAFVDIPVTLDVTSPPVLYVNPTTINVTTTEGRDPMPQPSTQLSNIGGSGTVVNYSINQPGPAWVNLSKIACNPPYGASVSGAVPDGVIDTVNVCIDAVTTALTPGTYSTTATIDAPGSDLASPGMNLLTINLIVLADSAPPQVVAGSVQLSANIVCSTMYAYGNIHWETDEPSSSIVYYTEQLDGTGKPDFNAAGAGFVVTDDVDVVARTGGTTIHDVLLDAAQGIVGGHTYYIKFASRDRYNNTSAFTDHDPADPSRYLSFSVPSVCDSTPPTNVTLTVPGGTLFGPVTVGMGAEDQSLITRFELYITGVGGAIATVTVPVGACASTGATYNCTVIYTLDTTLIPDGSTTIYARAYDAADNFADSPLVPITVSNSKPTVTNVSAAPSPIGNGLWQAVITWTTDVPSTSLVRYGPENDDGTFPGYLAVPKSGDDDPTCDGSCTSHTATLTNLSGGRIYHYQVESCSAVNPALCGH